MNTYHCQVRLGGNILHTVPRVHVTEMELKLLRHLHGADAVVDVKAAGETEVSERQELVRLARRYGPSENDPNYADENARRTGRQLVERCFGVKLDDFDDWLNEQVERRIENEQIAASEEALRSPTAPKIVQPQKPAVPESAIADAILGAPAPAEKRARAIE